MWKYETITLPPPPSKWRTKVLHGSNLQELENNINQFLNSLEVDVMIQSVQYAGKSDGEYSAMIVYTR